MLRIDWITLCKEANAGPDGLDLKSAETDVVALDAIPGSTPLALVVTMTGTGVDFGEPLDRTLRLLGPGGGELRRRDDQVEPRPARHPAQPRHFPQSYTLITSLPDFTFTQEGWHRFVVEIEDQARDLMFYVHEEISVPAELTADLVAVGHSVRFFPAGMYGDAAGLPSKLSCVITPAGTFDRLVGYGRDAGEALARARAKLG